MVDQTRAESRLGEVPEAREVMELVERVRPLLAGVEANVIGPALADLTALYLAGHIAENPRKTREMREAMLKIHLQAIRGLIPLNEAMIKERLEAARNALKDRPN